MSWIRDKLLGLRSIFDSGLALPDRGGINFIGATISDDPNNNRIDVEFPTSSDVAAATYLATPNTLVRRGAFGQANFAGTCQFATITATSVNVTTLQAGDADINDMIINNNLAVDGDLICSGAAALVGAVSCSSNITYTGGVAWQIRTAGGANSSALIFGSGVGTTTSGDVSVSSGTSTGASGALTLSSGSGSSNSGAVSLASGNATAGPTGATTISTGNATSIFGEASGAITITSGTATAISGSVTLTSGSGVNGSGSVVVQCGTSAAGPGGNVFLNPGVGTSTGNIGFGASPGSFQSMQRGCYFSNSSSAPVSSPASGAFLYVESGSFKWRTQGGTIITLGSISSFSTVEVTGDITYTSASGSFDISTSDGGATQITRAIAVSSGASNAASSGSVTMRSGNAINAGSSGSLTLGSGSSSGGSTGTVFLSTGSVLAGAGSSGDILIYPGTSTGVLGNISLGTSTPTFAGGQRVLHIPNRAALPTGSVGANQGAVIYIGNGGAATAGDQNGRLYVRTHDGTSTVRFVVNTLSA